MNAPVFPFSMTGETGRPISAAPVSLERMGVGAGSLRLLASDVDTLSFTTTKTATMTDFPLPANGQVLSLIDGDGRMLFTGKAEILPKTEGGKLRGYEATVTGPMQWMKDHPVETMVTDETGATALRPQISFPEQSLAQSLQTLFTLAESKGCPFVLGEVPDTLTLTPLFYPQMKFFDVLMKLLGFIPDSAAVMDYTAPGLPVLNIRRRSAARVVTLNFGADDHHCPELEMRPLPERQPEGVKTMWVEREANTYKPFFVSDQAGATTGRVQNIVISGEESGVIQLESYESVNVQTVAATNLPALLSFALDRDPFLKGLVTNYGALWYNDFTVSAGPYFVYFEVANTTVTWDAGSKVPNPILQAAKDGTSLSSGSWFSSATADRIPDWFPVALADGKLSFDLLLRLDYPTAATTSWGQGVEDFLQASYFNRVAFATSGGVQKTTFGLYQVKLDVTFLNQAYASLTTVYQPPAFGFTKPPSGLAAALFAAQDFLPWEGRAKFGNRRVDLPAPGDLMSADCEVPEWLTAKAAIKSLSLDLLSREGTVELGSPNLTTAGDLMEQFRRSGIVNTTGI